MSSYITRFTLKAIALAFLLSVVTTALLAQESFKGTPFVEVTGTAHEEIEPNEIYMMIRLREFEENKSKVNLEKLEKEFFEAIKQAGIDRKRLELADAGSRLDKLTKKEKEAFREKTYSIKLTSSAELERLLEKLEAVKVDMADVVRLSHSDLVRIKNDLRVKALMAAREKATALVTAVGGRVGRPLSIRDWDTEPVQPMMMNMKGNAFAESQMAGESTAFRKIRLQAQVNAQFAIE